MKKLSNNAISRINEFIPLAKVKADADVKVGGHRNWPLRYHFHMDQLCIQAGLRQGRVSGEYSN